MDIGSTADALAIKSLGMASNTSYSLYSCNTGYTLTPSTGSYCNEFGMFTPATCLPTGDTFTLMLFCICNPHWGSALDKAFFAAAATCAYTTTYWSSLSSGKIGTCTFGTMQDGATCTPTCNPGYALSGGTFLFPKVTSCHGGVLTHADCYPSEF